MLRNYLGTTIAYYKINKQFMLINLVGLSIGLTVCYFSFLYVNFELSYDSMHKNAENIYRLVTDVRTSTGIDHRGSSAPVGPAVKETFPEVNAATRIFLDYLIIQNAQGVQNEEKVAYADSTLFSVFTFPLVHGDPRNILNVPYQVVLSESCATKYFGEDNPVGRTLLINGRDQVAVTGVMKDIPLNSHIRIDMLVSLSTLLKAWNPSMEHNWKGLRASTYLLIRPGSDPTALNGKINRLLKSKIDQNETQYITSLEPLRSIYLYGKPRGSRSGSAVTGNSTNLYICSIVAVLVLFIANLNFINLSTAFSMKRAKEIGMRKLLGASRKGLTFQFLTDAILLSTLAFLLSLGLIPLIAPIFNEISGKNISAGIFEHAHHLGFLLLMAILTGALSGVYPAFFLSAFQPVDSLKGRFNSSVKGVRLRKMLVTSQFLISFILIVATVVFYKQLQFMQNQQLGFKKSHMLAIDFQFDPKAGSEFTKQQLMNIPGVSLASVSSSLPGRANHKIETAIRGVDGESELSNFEAYFVDYDFMTQYGLEIVAGRTFSNQIASDSSGAMIINEAAVRKLGYGKPDEVIGKPYSQWGRDGIIIGVIKDFHFQSFREEVQPLTFQTGNISGISTFLTLTISQTDLSSTISMIEEKWRSVVPDMPLTYFFTDEAYNSQYDSERRFGTLFICLVTIAIIISCLGLFGLSVFITLQRTKEIGIRKVLGSSVMNILTLLTKDFFVLIAIAACIGVPLSWYIMDKWLQEFAYRIDMNLWTFLFAGTMLTLIALATISLQTIRSAYADPVKSLRTE